MKTHTKMKKSHFRYLFSDVCLLDPVERGTLMYRFFLSFVLTSFNVSYYRGQKRCLTPLRYVHKIVGIGTHPKNASRILWRRDNKPCKVFLRTRSTIPTVATPTKFGREHDFFTVTSENASCSLNIVRHFFCNSRFLTPVAWVDVFLMRHATAFQMSVSSSPKMPATSEPPATCYIPTGG